MIEVLKDPSFVVVLDGPKGTHSIRKMATNEARKRGCGKNATDHRARWKTDTRQQDTYADTTIPTVDAGVAAKLCIGGPLFYSLRLESRITNDWILTYVVPCINAKYGPCIANVLLGRALLWRIFDPEQSKVVNLRKVEQVKNAYGVFSSRNRLDDGENPVAKIPIIVDQIEGEVSIEPFFSEEELTQFENYNTNTDTDNNNKFFCVL